MSFSPGIPSSGQSIGSSRLQVQNNFSALRTTISNASLPNHIDVNATGAGKHIFLQMPVQTPSAANLTLSGEFGLISKTANGISELFFNRDGVNVAGTPTYIQMTSGLPISSQTGQSFLPGGILLKWGTKPSLATGSTFNLTYAGVGLTPMLTSTFGIFVIGDSNNRTYFPSNITATSFTINASSALGSGDVFFWFAIGN